MASVSAPRASPAPPARPPRSAGCGPGGLVPGPAPCAREVAARPPPQGGPALVRRHVAAVVQQDGEQHEHGPHQDRPQHPGEEPDGRGDGEDGGARHPRPQPPPIPGRGRRRRGPRRRGGGHGAGLGAAPVGSRGVAGTGGAAGTPSPLVVAVHGSRWPVIAATSVAAVGRSAGSAAVAPGPTGPATRAGRPGRRPARRTPSPPPTTRRRRRPWPRRARRAGGHPGGRPHGGAGARDRHRAREPGDAEVDDARAVGAEDDVAGREVAVDTPAAWMAARASAIAAPRARSAGPVTGPWRATWSASCARPRRRRRATAGVRRGRRRAAGPRGGWSPGAGRRPRGRSGRGRTGRQPASPPAASRPRGAAPRRRRRWGRRPARPRPSRHGRAARPAGTGRSSGRARAHRLPRGRAPAARWSRP